MTTPKETGTDLDARLARMPRVAERDFTASVMRRIARRRQRIQLAYFFAWGCALLGVIRAIPLTWLAEQVDQSLIPAAAQGSSTWLSLQQLLSIPLSTSAPELSLWLALAAGLAMITLLVSALFD